MPLIRVGLLSTPQHVINQHCAHLLNSEIDGPRTIFSIYDPRHQNFFEGVLIINNADNTRDSIQAFDRVNSGRIAARKYSYPAFARHLPLPQETPDASEDEGFAPDFSLRQWANTRSVSSMSGREGTREEPRIVQRAPRVSMDMPSRVVLESGSSSISWDVPSTANTREPPSATRAMEYYSTYEGLVQSTRGERQSGRDARSSLEETDNERSARGTTRRASRPDGASFTRNA